MPTEIRPLSTAVTPFEYAEAISAIKSAMAKPDMRREMEEELGLGPLDWIEGAKIPLGPLGTGLMIKFQHSPACGNGGCPMWLLLPDSKGYRMAIDGGGWGYRVVKSGQAVPDIVTYWHMGADDTSVGHYHFDGTQFVARSQECNDNTGDSDDCAGIENAFSDAFSISPAEYEQIKKRIKIGTAATAGRPRPAPSAEIHVIDFPLVNQESARVIGIGDCGLRNNCAISVYGCKSTEPYAESEDPAKVNIPVCELWPMLTGIRGWCAANFSDLETDPFKPRYSIAIASRISDDKVELRRYSAIVWDPDTLPGTKLSQDGCMIVHLTNGQWPSDEVIKTQNAHTEPCLISAK
jgi:hypothetical protein